MILLIRNMESERCIAKVKEELENLGLRYKSVELGEAELAEDLSGEKLRMLACALMKSGLELMVDTKAIIIKKTKRIVLELVYLSDTIGKPKLSDYISKRVNHNYNYLSKIFSEMAGMTIEKYYVEQRIERVKVMLLANGNSLSDIAYKLLYSSVAHLSNQFKKVTGVTPFNFRFINKQVLQKSVTA